MERKAESANGAVKADIADEKTARGILEQIQQNRLAQFSARYDSLCKELGVMLVPKIVAKPGGGLDWGLDAVLIQA